MMTLYIANKNYSSWSLRPWFLLQELGIPFEERLLPFGDEAAWGPFRALSPSGKVPLLVDDGRVVWDSLAIVEFVAERHPGVWPAAADARAWARCAAAEMHSGFHALRAVCSMNVGVRVRLHEVSPALAQDVARIDALWCDGLARFGGPWLAGGQVSAVDAFFAPVAFRIQTYGLALSPAAMTYARALLELPSMQRWYRDGVAETFRDAAHDAEIPAVGVVTADLRA